MTAFQRRVLNRFHGHCRSEERVGLTVVAAHNEAVLARVLAVAHGAGRVVVGAPQPNIIYDANRSLEPDTNGRKTAQGAAKKRCGLADDDVGGVHDDSGLSLLAHGVLAANPLVATFDNTESVHQRSKPQRCQGKSIEDSRIMDWGDHAAGVITEQIRPR